MRRFCLTVATLAVLCCPLSGQQNRPKRKPVLIRADRTQEAEEQTPPVPDPAQAKKHVEIGDFYYKRDNFKAATERYRDAIKLNPGWAEPYERLIRALEKQEAYSEAIGVCEQFTRSNPSSEETKDFRKRAQELREVNQKEVEPETG